MGTPGTDIKLIKKTIFENNSFSNKDSKILLTMVKVNMYKIFTCAFLCASVCHCTLRALKHMDFQTDFTIESMTVADIDLDGTYEVIVAV